MMKSEETYAAGLNVLGSDPLPTGPVEQSVDVLRAVAVLSGEINRLTAAYLEVLGAMAPCIGEGAKKLADELLEAARVNRVRYISGMPLLIEGLDCSPEHVRQLMTDKKRYRDLYVNGGKEA